MQLLLCFESFILFGLSSGTLPLRKHAVILLKLASFSRPSWICKSKKFFFHSIFEVLLANIFCGTVQSHFSNKRKIFVSLHCETLTREIEMLVKKIKMASLDSSSVNVQNVSIPPKKKKLKSTSKLHFIANYAWQPHDPSSIFP